MYSKTVRAFRERGEGQVLSENDYAPIQLSICILFNRTILCLEFLLQHPKRILNSITCFITWFLGALATLAPARAAAGPCAKAELCLTCVISCLLPLLSAKHLHPPEFASYHRITTPVRQGFSSTVLILLSLQFILFLVINSCRSLPVHSCSRWPPN